MLMHIQWNLCNVYTLGTHSQRVLIRGVSLFLGLFNIHKILLGQHAVSALQWMSLVQECPQGRVPLYIAGELLLN